MLQFGKLGLQMLSDVDHLHCLLHTSISSMCMGCVPLPHEEHIPVGAPLQTRQLMHMPRLDTTVTSAHQAPLQRQTAPNKHARSELAISWFIRDDWRACTHHQSTSKPRARLCSTAGRLGCKACPILAHKWRMGHKSELHATCCGCLYAGAHRGKLTERQQVTMILKAVVSSFDIDEDILSSAGELNSRSQQPFHQAPAYTREASVPQLS